MVSSSWLSLYPVITELLKNPKSFDFVQAMHLLGRINARGKRSAAIQIAHLGSIKAQVQARFVNDYRMNFPVAAITKAEAKSDSIVEFTVSGFGYVGAIGVLPYSYSYIVNLTQSTKNYGLKAFLDIFQNRSVEFFYQAASKYRISLSYDRGRVGDIDKFKKTLESFVGFGFSSLKDRLNISDENLLYYSGFLSSSKKTIYALEVMLAEELSLNIHVMPFSGRWIRLFPEDQTILINFKNNSHYNRLNADAVIGERVWSVQNFFRILVGPIKSDRLQDLLPQGRDDIKIRDIIETYCGKEYEYEIQLVVEAKSVPFSQLASNDDPSAQCRLGQNSWILACPSPIDRKDAIFFRS